MCKIRYYVLLLLLALSMTSCGVSSALVTNHNQNATEVHLSQNNFKVIDQVSGSAEVSYVMALGGMKKKQLYENAYSEMLKKAKLLGGSKAIINVITEEHTSGFAPFFVKRIITISAQVVEFTR